MGKRSGEGCCEELMLCEGGRGRLCEDGGPGVVGDPGDDERVLKMIGEGEGE